MALENMQDRTYVRPVSPNPPSTRVRTQAERSSATKQRLLQATVASLVDLGYRGTTMDAVAKRAGLSRGAQLHHYGSRERMIAAAVEYLAERRLTEIERKAALLRNDDSRPRRALQLLAATLSGPLYAAAVELWVIGRVDDQLRDALLPVERRVRDGLQEWCRRFISPDPVVAELTFELLLGAGVAGLLAPTSTRRRNQLLDVWMTMLPSAAASPAPKQRRPQ